MGGLSIGANRTRSAVLFGSFTLSAPQVHLEFSILYSLWAAILWHQFLCFIVFVRCRSGHNSQEETLRGGSLVV